MRTVKKILFALAVTAALFTLNAHSTHSNAHILIMEDPGTAGGVSDQEVIDYLMSFGYMDVVIEYTRADGDRICWANDMMGNPHHIQVDVEHGSIVGHNELPD